MVKFNNETSYVIARNDAIGYYCRVNPNGSHSPLAYKVDMKVGEVARIVAKLYPEKQIGIMSDTFGPATKQVYGEIVWMKKGFELTA